MSENMQGLNPPPPKKEPVTDPFHYSTVTEQVRQVQKKKASRDKAYLEKLMIKLNKHEIRKETQSEIMKILSKKRLFA